jgi:hypothetical protein
MPRFEQCINGIIIDSFIVTNNDRDAKKQQASLLHRHSGKHKSPCSDLFGVGSPKGNPAAIEVTGCFYFSLFLKLNSQTHMRRKKEPQGEIPAAQFLRLYVGIK